LAIILRHLKATLAVQLALNVINDPGVVHLAER